MRSGRRSLAGAVACAVACALSAPPARGAAAASTTITPGEVELAFTTTTTKGKYAPKHVLAVWVTDSRDGFVRTLLLNAKSKKKYLQRWVKETGKDVVDAVTGATLTAHGAVAARWDCRDAKGEVVPDGEYRLEIEFAEDHNRGPTTPPAHIAFAKGAKPVTVEPKDLGNLKGMKLVYAPVAARKSAESPSAPVAEADSAGRDGGRDPQDAGTGPADAKPRTGAPDAAPGPGTR